MNNAFTQLVEEYGNTVAFYLTTQIFTIYGIYVFDRISIG